MNGHGARLMSCLNFNFGLGELDVLGVVATKNTQIVHAGEEVVIEQEINHKSASVVHAISKQDARNSQVPDAGFFGRAHP